MITRSRRARVVSCQLQHDRPIINAAVSRETHTAFDAIAKARNLGNSTLARLLIEAVARDPRLCDLILCGDDVAEFERVFCQLMKPRGTNGTTPDHAA